MYMPEPGVSQASRHQIVVGHKRTNHVKRGTEIS